jgi:hypothetical protein
VELGEEAVAEMAAIGARSTCEPSDVRGEEPRLVGDEDGGLTLENAELASKIIQAEGAEAKRGE